MIHTITDDGMHAGHDDKGREFTFLTNAATHTRAHYEQTMRELGALTEFGISDLAFDHDGNEIPDCFAIYVLTASHVDRRHLIDAFVAVEERLDHEASTVK